MGFMTVVTVLNDSLHDIERDPSFGKRLVRSIMAFSRSKRNGDDRTVAAYSWHNGEPRGVFCNAAEVSAQSHADHKQFVCAWRNTSWEITTDPDDGVPDSVIKELRWVLKERSSRTKRANGTMTAPERKS